MKRGAAYFLVLMFLMSSVNSLHVENMTNTDFHSAFFSVFIPLDNIVVVNLKNNYISTQIKVKVGDRSQELIRTNLVHNQLSNKLLVNVSEYNFSNFLTNTSKYYVDFISSLNTTAKVIVGKNVFDDHILSVFDIGLADGFVKYKNNVGVYPFNSAIVSFEIDSQKFIVIYGNAVEGEISALRYLKKHLDEFVFLDKSYFLNDIDSLSVYDFMHLKDNHPYYNIDSKKFEKIVQKSLFGKVEEKIIDVKTNEGVMLRVLQVEPQNSDKLISYRHNITLPIVLARGLWSNLYSWEKFGIELADEGREVYLIEITGGPGQDCPTCVNYDYNDLINSYWPAMIGTIQTLENNSKLQYVGHSNGARTGVSSLEIYNNIGKQNTGAYFNNTAWINVSMTPQPIDTYIAVGMPGAFEGETPLGIIIKTNGDNIQRKILLNNLTHVSKRELETFGLTTMDYITPYNDNKISKGLWDDYYYWISSEEDIQPGFNLSLDNILLIRGTLLLTNDGIVTVNDMNNLYDGLISDNKHYYSFYGSHSKIMNMDISKVIIKNFLNTKRIYTTNKMIYVNGTGNN